MLAGMSRVALVITLTACAPACSDDAPTLTCVDDVDFGSCAALYAPTFENVYANTITRGCATGGRSCHAAAGNQGGLTLEGEARAYEALSARYLTPGDAACSELVMRLYTDEPALLMPRGARLPDPEACAIGKWVHLGAAPPASLIDAGVGAGAPSP
jgi:hypothetical protein